LLLATLQRDIFLSLTDNTANLTGRLAIWRPMIQFYLDHPLLGSGYGAYWDASAGLVDNHVLNSGMWKNIDQAHNGYLDVLVQLGLPGLALALYAAFVWPMGGLIPMIGRNPQRAGLIFALLVFFMIENLSESSLFADDALGNAFLLLALAYTHQFALQSSKRRKPDETQGVVSAVQLRESRQKRRRSCKEI
jgi:O-antigen ligase